MVSNAIPFATSRPAAKGGNYTRENAQFHWGVTPPGHWALFDVKKDPGCQNDLAESKPKRASTMAAAYDAWWDKIYPVMVERGGDAELVLTKQAKQPAE